MIVDSYRFLPRSFRAMYEPASTQPADVWASFEKRLADSSIALLTSAGLYCSASQPSFDLDRERAEPTWGDPTLRVLPADVRGDELAMAHLHVNHADIVEDVNVALPLELLDDLAGDGMIGAVAPSHLSVMGYQQAGLDVWRDDTGPQIVDVLRSERTDGLILAPV